MSPDIKYPCVAKVVLPQGLEPRYDIKNGIRVILLGEISNMPGHVVFVDEEGIVQYGYHLEDFRILSSEET